MASCIRCNSYVSSGFARVFGDNDGVVHECPSCANDV
ncbi:DUF7563 family protein [Natronomonas sp. EA1]